MLISNKVDETFDLLQSCLIPNLLKQYHHNNAVMRCKTICPLRQLTVNNIHILIFIFCLLIINYNIYGFDFIIFLLSIKHQTSAGSKLKNIAVYIN